MEKDKSDITIYSFIGNRKMKFICSIILAILAVGSEMIAYIGGATLICMIFRKETDFNKYLNLLGVIGLGYILRSICMGLSTYVSHKATFEVLYDIRCALIEKLKKVPLGFVQETPTGVLKNTIIDKVDGLEQYLAHLIPELIANLFIPIIIIIYLCTVSVKMTLIMLIPLPVVLLCCKGMMIGFDEKCKKFYAAKEKVNATVIEYVRGIEVIKAFNRSADSYQKFSDAVYDNAKCGYEWQKGAQLFLSAAICILHSTMLTILPLGYYFLHKGSISTDTLIIFILLTIGLMTPMIKAMFMFETTTKMEAEFGSIASMLAEKELVRPAKGKPLEMPFDINMEHVVFSYKNEEESKIILNDVNLSIPYGKVTALVGASGSGKSTIAKLLAGFWDVNQGSIRIGGANIKEISQSALVQSIAYVSQDCFLFNDTIMENIRIGKKNATDEEVIQAAKACGCHDFIMNLENGYETAAGEGGCHLSGGERQRITIVRALLKDAMIVILDEATSYTDPENEAVIQRSISKLVEGRTLIVIAHRLSTIVNADKIVVVNNGHIEASGKQKELIETCELYRNMWESHIGVRKQEIQQ